MKTRISATQLHDHLVCPHRVAMDAAEHPPPRDEASPFLELLWQHGIAREQSAMAASGQPFLDLSGLTGNDKEAATRAALARGAPLIYGGRLSVGELVGEPDILRRDRGGYAAIDIRSGAGVECAEGGELRLRSSHGVQLALYTDMLEQLGLSAGRQGYIRDIHGEEVRYDLNQKPGPRSPCLWEIYLKVRQRVRETLADPSASRPALASACRRCVWRSACLRRLRQRRDLTLLPELGRAARDALLDEFPTVDVLAAADVEQYIDGDRTPFRRIGADALRRFQRRAALAIDSGAKPCLTRPIAWPQAPVELFFDVQADPMRGVCYLHGLLIRDRGGERFEGFFVARADASSEREAFARAMALFRRHPEGLVLHSSKCARAAYRRLVARYPEVARPEEVEALFGPPRAVDLCHLARSTSEWPTTDFSIRSLAAYCGFHWRDADPSGASSVEWFDGWVATGAAPMQQRLLDCNEDHCRAMRVVWDALRQLPVRC